MAYSAKYPKPTSASHRQDASWNCNTLAQLPFGALLTQRPPAVLPSDISHTPKPPLGRLSPASSLAFLPSPWLRSMRGTADSLPSKHCPKQARCVLLPPGGHVFSCVSRFSPVDSATPWTVAHPPGFSCPWGFPSEVGCHALLQGIFLTRGSNLGLLHCRQILYCLSS